MPSLGKTCRTFELQCICESSLFIFFVSGFALVFSQTFCSAGSIFIRAELNNSVLKYTTVFGRLNSIHCPVVNQQLNSHDDGKAQSSRARTTFN